MGVWNMGDVLVCSENLCDAKHWKKEKAEHVNTPNPEKSICTQFIDQIQQSLINLYIQMKVDTSILI